MNPQVPVSDELLSAYFDGEASPEERAIVEQLLDGSVASRCELDEIAQLSALLHSFPREAAPVELASRVQGETDLLPLAEQKAVASIAPVRSLRREWMAACLGAVATAVALLLMVNLVDRPASHLQALRENDSATKLALATTATPGMEDRLSEKGSLTAEALKRDLARLDDATQKQEMSGDDAAVAANQPSPATAAMRRRSLSVQDEVRSEGQNSFDENAKSKPLAGLANNSVATDNLVPPVYFNNSDFLSGLRVGEVYQFVPQVADPESNVAVVELAVLDIERGADQVQVLLSRNSIRPRQSSQAGQAGQTERFAKPQSSKPGEPSNSNDIVVVYSVGPGEHLAKALEDMSRQPELFLSWATQPPVQLPVVESLAEGKADRVAAKDSAVPAKEKSRDQQSVTRSKISSADDDMEVEAAQALNALLARGNDANYADTAVTNGTEGSSADGSRAASKLPDVIADQPTPQPATASGKKFVENSGKGQPNAADPAPSVADGARQNSDLKRNSTGPDGVGLGRAYQQRIHVQANAIQGNLFQGNSAVPIEPLQSNNVQSQGLNARGAMNSYRRGSNEFLPQQNNFSRADGTRNEVKVLFVLHSPQAPAAPGAITPAKPNR